MIVEYLGKRYRPHELAQFLEHARRQTPGWICLGDELPAEEGKAA
jgi:hypothetical protein